MTRLIVVLLLVLLTRPSFAATDCSVADVPKVECEVLLALYNSTGGANWRQNSGWNQDNTVCGWFGVTCENGHITVLILSGNLLTGSLPPELGKLSNLLELRLGGNQLTGTIPVEFGRLSNSQWLNLSFNQLTGTIPVELGKLSNLWGLHLSGNQLIGTIPDFSALANKSYRVVDFSYNQFSGETNGTATALDPDWATTQLSNQCDGMSTLGFNPKILDFGSEAIGNTFALKQTIGYNWLQTCGALQIDPNSFTLTGTNASEFRVQNVTCYHSNYWNFYTASCTLEVVFSPTTNGDKEANLAFLLTDPKLPVSPVQIKGQVIEGGTPNSALSNAVITGTVTSKGWLSNLTVTESGSVTGGIITGSNHNQGYLGDFEFRGEFIKGGVLGGKILNLSKIFSWFEDVTLAANAHLIGGALKGKIKGDPKKPALLENLRILSESVVSGVIIGKGVKIDKDVQIETTTTDVEPADYAKLPTLDEQFSAGIGVNASSYQTKNVAQILSDNVSIRGKIHVKQKHIGQKAKIFVTVTYRASADSSEEFRFTINRLNGLLPWDGKDSFLGENPFSEETLQTTQPVKIYDGILLATGVVKIHFGYLSEDGTVVKSPESVELTTVN